MLDKFGRHLQAARIGNIQTYKANIDSKPGDETITFNPDTGAVQVDGKGVQASKFGGTYSFTSVDTDTACTKDRVTATIDTAAKTATVTETHTLKGACIPIDANYYRDGQGSPKLPDLITNTSNIY